MPAPGVRRYRLLAVAALAFPTVGWADGASGSFSVSVTLPPIAAGLQAQSEGAVGLNSLDQPGQGLMVRSPDQIAPGDQGQLQVFTLQGRSVTVRVADGGPAGAPSTLASVQPGPTVPMNGMDRTTFIIQQARPVEPQDGNANVVSVVVSSL